MAKVLSAYEKKWLTMKRVATKNGDVFIPMKTVLGVYYLRFHKPAGYNYFEVWRTNEVTLAPTQDVFVAIATGNEIRSNSDSSTIRGFWIPFSEIKEILKMVKKLK
jgi:hypothetical protein